MEDTAKAVETADGGVKLVGVVRDITARRLAERQLAQVTAEADRRQRLHEAIMSSTSDPAFIVDSEYRFLYANDALLDVLGATWDEVIGQCMATTAAKQGETEEYEREVDHIVATGESVRGEFALGDEDDRRIYDYLMVPVFGGDASLEHGSGGLGLGLALVRGVVDLHGGDIVAHSDGIGQGAEFIISLPVLDISEPDSPFSQSDGTSDSLCVLVVEDNADIAEMLRIVLELKGHQVLVANDGRKGLEKARAAGPDAIICDIGLPGMDGFTLAEVINDDPALESTLIIALSGYARPEDIQKSMDAGFDYHLAKPPDIEELEEVLVRSRDRK